MFWRALHYLNMAFAEFREDAIVRDGLAYHGPVPEYFSTIELYLGWSRSGSHLGSRRSRPTEKWALAARRYSI